MSRVVLVRHAMPRPDPALPPAKWELSEDGRAASRGLAGSLPTEATALASTEVKAQQTLHLALGRLADTDAGFDEVYRPVEPIEQNVRARRRAWAAGSLDNRHIGWEPAGEAAARFDCAVRAAPDGDLIVATHGMVLTAWLVWRGVLEPGEPAALFWEALSFPDVIEIER